MPEWESIAELVEAAETAGKRISDIILLNQVKEMDKSKEELYNAMKKHLHVMEESINNGLSSDKKSISGFSGGDAMRIKNAADNGLLGKSFSMVIARAIAVSEVNACMGRVVAAPTAGSCGIMPAVIISIREERGLSEDAAIMALFTASAFGMIIAERATLAGAEGGCQAECGSAAAIAAAAIVEMTGGTPKMSANACALALKNSLGLVCDTVAGLVEIPCIKRNGIYAINAVASATMALAGVESAIPVDEVIDAMMDIGNALPATLKETSKGGLAVTPTGIRLAEEFKSKKL